jgi:hypothetical protein
MLTKESSRGFNPAISYPTYRYISKKGTREQANCDRSRILPKPRGYIEVIEFLNEEEHFQDYLKWNSKDLKGIPDEKFKEHPYGIFHGNWKNARWYDEAQRRELI